MQLRNSAASGETTTASTSWLIIQVSNLQTPEGLVWAIPLALLLPKIMLRITTRFRV